MSKKVPMYLTEPEDEASKNRAAAFTQPELTAAMTIVEGAPKNTTGENGERNVLDANAVYHELIDKTERAMSGDLSDIERLLTAQAHTLDMVFHKYLRRAMNAKSITELKAYSNISLAAQRQCRTTADSLAEIKNPKPYIQNNRAQYQQINNNGEPSRAGENEKPRNELLEDKTHDPQWLDTGKTTEAGRGNQELEALEA